VAEGVGFEPTAGCPAVVFKTTPFGRSGIPPPPRLPARRGYRADPMAGWIAERQAHTQQVVGRDDRIWTVRRVVLPRPPRWIRKKRQQHRESNNAKKRESSWMDALDGLDFVANVGDALDGPGVGIVVGIFALAAIVLAIVFLFPVLFFLADLLILLLIAGVGILLRVFLRRPWKIEAKTPGPPPEEITWGVVGMRASAKAVETVAAGISRGDPPGSMLTG
jgi:hypothetical protein